MIVRMVRAQSLISLEPYMEQDPEPDKSKFSFIGGVLTDSILNPKKN